MPQQISRMAQGVLDILRRGIAGPGKGAEGSHIGEVPGAELAHIVGHGLALQDLLRRLHDIGGELQAAGKIVGGAGRDIADRDLETCPAHAGDGLIEGAVATAADDQVDTGTKAAHRLLGGAGAGGHMDRHIIARLGIEQKDIRKEAVGPFLAGKGIHKEQHFFHRTDLSERLLSGSIIAPLSGTAREDGKFNIPFTNRRPWNGRHNHRLCGNPPAPASTAPAAGPSPGDRLPRRR